jgi:CRP/FNR family transcriptional regulator, cyclic AMP receptor protein
MFTEGDPANEFYFIRKGLVSVELMVQNSGPTAVRTLGGGEILGCSWVSPPYHWHFNARTLKPTRALVFDANCLHAKCEEAHHLGCEMLKRFSNMRLRFPQRERRFFLKCLLGPAARET